MTTLDTINSWTRFLPDTDHIRFIKSVDWSKTHVGPIENWPPGLRQSFYQVIADSRPATLYWGPEYVPIYNEAFVPLAGKTHPSLMGSTFKQGFPEIWQGIGPLFELATSTGAAADVIEAPMTVERNGYPEETFFTGNFTPIRDSEGEIVGFYNALFEVTKQKINDRRTAVLNRIASSTNLTTESVCRHVMDCLETNENDITMAIMYQLDGEDEPENVFHLRGQLGVPEEHPLLVDGQSWSSSKGLIPLCRLARSRGTPMVFTVNEMFHDIIWRGPGGPSRSVAIIPLSSGTRLLGFLITGTNPLLLDEQNTQFLQDLSRMVSGVMTLAVSVTQSRRRQERLERDLANSDIKIQHLVQHASVAMVHLLVDGTTIWANNQYFAMVEQEPTELQHDYGIFQFVLEEDLPIAENAWQQVVNGEERVSAEVRLKRPYVPPIGDSVPATVLLLAFPYRENDTVRSVMACATDVSRLKWAETWQARIAKDAQEAKRQQEAFIDIVSHEMRNPLSAIVHCVDSIITSFEDLHDHTSIPQPYVDALTENVSAARIIETCVEHQRYIIDSVLTLGRMESEMLSITPRVVLLESLTESIIAMFAKEMEYSNISLQLVAHPSYAQLEIDQVLADASRITQILINLLTNAIKFVKNEVNRHIKVQYGACKTHPRLSFPTDTHWAEKGDKAEDATLREEWGDGEQIYLTFSVKDSGIGVDQAQQSRIFERFKQANIKTHVFYGGSGLGLFISKQLTEKQGGEIGIRSAPGQGSTFIFYILVRRAPTALHTSPHSKGPIKSQIPMSRTPVRSPESLPAAQEIDDDVPIHVLLVEDNLVNQTVLRKQLQRLNCIVHTANHGADALSLLPKFSCYANTTGGNGNDATEQSITSHPKTDIIGEEVQEETVAEVQKIPLDIILMDAQMPIMGGLECTRRIRSMQNKGLLKRHVPIIAVTANARVEQREEMVAAGSDTVMSKPFKSKDLVAMMKEQLKIHGRG
ncbi:putative histidine kinase HHK15p [Microthyrium microscopicum]|uniref:Putative histidine kinase HHK15p n=1 Tax=Microthyrium microscopicum TaxID=703497 RepID=A0A6A6UCS4_9PEZI|nr:putative histidine kinase HHK15p [Microthyrium microscopicum]